jgi:hypothetical protein
LRHDRKIMRELRCRWLVLAVLATVLLVGRSTTALAAAHIALPAGWGESAAAAPEAQRRASRWQTALGLRLAQVASAAQDDRFAETVAVFERGEPISELAFADEATAIDTLTAEVVNIVGVDPPVAAELRTIGSGETIVWGRWLVDDLSYECALAPSGDTATLVIAAVRAREADLHQPTLDALFDRLTGVSAPMPRFSLLAWRLGSIVVWLALALGLHAVMLPLGDREHDHGQAGLRASAITLALVIVGTAATVVALRGRELALIHAGTSLAAIAVWVGVTGFVVAAVHYFVSSRLHHGVVQSAPATGAYASGVYSSADVLRSSVSRSGISPSSQSGLRGKIVIDDDDLE